MLFDTVACNATQSLAFTVWADDDSVTTGNDRLLNVLLVDGVLPDDESPAVPNAVVMDSVGAGGALTVACTVTGVAASADGAAVSRRLPSW